ncbi:MAG TPA: hypothetical protein VFL69_05145 [Marmoricola sp.]|nr:hypothetical protein [Marmoricola sp.]
MGIFATLARKSGSADPRRGQGLPQSVPQGLPGRFEAVGEALASGCSVEPACALLGRDLARDGVDLGEALGGLRATYEVVTGEGPDVTAVEALALAWGEETLGYAHQISCEDPLTGLASLAHLRARLSEVYREADQSGSAVSTTHALVVVELPLLAGVEAREGRFGRALWMVRVAETVRLVFPGSETICQAGGSRLIVVGGRGDVLGRKVVALAGLLEGLGGPGRGAQVWIEGLPAGNDAAASLLDELARV